MSEEQRNTFRYRVLRYAPNLIRDEWVNVGVILEEVDGSRRAARLIEEPAEMARVRRLHPGADEDLLRRLPAEFDARLRAPETEVRTYLEKLDQTLSNVLQLSPQRGLLAENFDAELDRLFHDYVAPPPTARGGIGGNIRKWMRDRLRDVFRRHRIFGKIEASVRVDDFTQPGDPMRIDYAYRYNGTRGYIQTVALGRDPAQAKVFAYTAERIRARAAQSEFTAITEIEPALENRRHQFISRLFEEQRIRLVPLDRVEKFAEELRPRLN
ncbi:MAG TPA: DUF3037 domain-containing protein [Candidatus Acidoferrales bacterium]|nr:DUF3037 domain-containing protein [Candidatus Acidoferrales bacterium]